jgi:glycosyltransferase involved in cell wall biosynthesis
MMSKFVSFSRNMEDVLLWRMFKSEENGFYIDIYAESPDRESITKGLYEKGWSGLNLHRDISVLNLFEHFRPNDDNLYCVLSTAANHLGENSTVDGSRPNALSTWSIGRGFNQSRRQVFSFDEIYDRFVPPSKSVHFLRVNLGADFDHLFSYNNWLQFRPWVLIIATRDYVDADCIDLDQNMRSISYEIAYFNDDYRFYLATEKETFASFFDKEPSLVDGFIPHEFSLIMTELAGAKSQLADLHERIGSLNHEVLFLRSKIDVLENNKLLKIVSASRKLNPERIIRRAIRKRFPKKGIFTSEELSGFIEIKIGDITINFAAEALRDQRGIGRVAREYLAELRSRQNKDQLLPIKDADNKIINFYPSIHWCPENLNDNSLVMIHDVIPLLFPDLFPRKTIDDWRNKYAYIASKAGHILTVSHSSAESISRELSIPMSKISVAYNGVTIFDTDGDDLNDSPEREQYFVCIGSFDYHKNLKVIFDAALLPDFPDCKIFVVGAGHNNEKLASYGSKIRFTGKLSDAELFSLVKNSRGLLFPSLYEGFGLPPLEALALGVPAICSSRPAMTELLEQGVLFCKPHDPNEWVKAMVSLMSSPPSAEESRDMREFVRNGFTWAKSVDSMMEAIKKM